MTCGISLAASQVSQRPPRDGDSSRPFRRQLNKYQPLRHAGRWKGGRHPRSPRRRRANDLHGLVARRSTTGQDYVRAESIATCMNCTLMMMSHTYTYGAIRLCSPQQPHLTNPVSRPSPFSPGTEPTTPVTVAFRVPGRLAHQGSGAGQQSREPFAVRAACCCVIDVTFWVPEVVILAFGFALHRQALHSPALALII